MPLPIDVFDNQRNEILEDPNIVLSKVKEYIEVNQNPKKRNNCHAIQDNFEQVPTITEIISQLNLTKYEYYNCLPISNNSDYQIIESGTQMCALSIYLLY